MLKDTDVQPKKTVNIYISYASDGESIYEKLKINLNGLRNIAKTFKVNPYEIAITTSQDIVAGVDIADLCETNLNAAHIILLLISPAFIYDAQCFTDMNNGLERTKSGDPTVRTIPIKARAVSDSIWTALPVHGLQSLPPYEKTIPDRANSRDQAFSDITEALISVIKSLLPSIPLVATPEPVIQPASPVAAAKGPAKVVPGSKYSEAEVRRHVVILKEQLAYLYDDPANMRNILQNVGIQARDISLGGVPMAAWTNIVEYAQRRKKLLELAAEAFRAFPEDDILAVEVPYWQGYYKQ
ncbi:hypothetical protein ccbrp13_03530 [Ktedonobacteria bacterium brp13]|nr:hypothetical protein ccbrp13_03530 [Ktedonobacteria bacterium brp13]